MQPEAPAAAHTLPTFAGSTAEGKRALKVGIVLLAITAGLQAVLYLASGSVALLGDTLHNGLDAAGTGAVWLAFVIAARGRSPKFTYGYHRFEDLAGLLVVLLIVLSAALVLVEAGRALEGDPDIRRAGLVLVAGLVGFAGNEGVARYKIRAGRRIQSAALVADGEHSRADGLTSLGVIAAAAGAWWGAEWVDAVAGLAIGLVIAYTAYRAGREVLLRLLDSADPALHGRLVAAADAVAGVDHVSDLRLRQAGRTVQAVASVCVRAEVPLSEAHDAAEALRMVWLQMLPPGSSVAIHVDPYTPGHPVPHLEESVTSHQH